MTFANPTSPADTGTTENAVTSPMQTDAERPELPHQAWFDAVEELRNFRLYDPTPLSNGKDPAPARYPDFYICGPQKTGTTWLTVQLQMHPQIWSPILKEPMYFSEYWDAGDCQWIRDLRRTAFESSVTETNLSVTRLNHLWPQSYISAMRASLFNETTLVDDGWYADMFRGCGIDQLCYDATATYCILPRAALNHMRRLSPQGKIILILRNPIDRVWSYLRMQLQILGDFSQACQDAILESQAATLFQSSNYPAIIEKMTSVFGHESVLVLGYENISSRPLELLAAVCKFVGIERDFRFFYNSNSKVFPGPPRDLGEETRSRINDLLRPLKARYLSELPEFCANWRLD